MRPFVIADSVTELGANAEGTVVLAASHGGHFAVSLALERGVAALLVHDAGVGRGDAGVAGLSLAESHRVPCAAIDYMSARIGDGRDCLARGRISRVNRMAEAVGLRCGMAASAAAETLIRARIPQRLALGRETAEARRRLDLGAARAVWLLDSASLVEPGDAGAIVVTASHGGVLGGRQATAIKAPVFAALFNDAGVGVDRAGLSRLPVLEERGIAGATVAASSARIGDGPSTYYDGVVSFVNGPAAALGAVPGMAARDLVGRLAQAPVERTTS